MRILYLCCDPGIPVYGRKGASSHVRGTCLALQERGHEVRLLCANTDGDQEGEGVVPAVRIDAPESRKLGFDLRRILLDRRLTRYAFQTLIPQWRPDAVYERYCLYSLVGSRIARRLRLPHILELNAFLSEEQKDRIRIPALARLYERRAVRSAREIFVVSSPLKEAVHRIAGPDMKVLIEPMSVDTERFSGTIDASGLRRRLGLESSFVIGYVGTLSGWHGIRYFYDLARSLKDRNIPDFRILVVGGDGHKLERHRQRVKEGGFDRQIQFVGAVPHSEVPLYIRAMDVGLIPDANPWNAPTKLFEYQACAIAPVGPDYPGVRASLDDGVEGFIFPPQDVPAMVTCIEKLYRNPELRAELGRRSRLRVCATRSWDRAAATIVSNLEAQRSGLQP